MSSELAAAGCLSWLGIDYSKLLKLLWIDCTRLSKRRGRGEVTELDIWSLPLVLTKDFLPDPKVSSICRHPLMSTLIYQHRLWLYRRGSIICWRWHRILRHMRICMLNFSAPQPTPTLGVLTILALYFINSLVPPQSNTINANHSLNLTYFLSQAAKALGTWSPLFAILLQDYA